MGSSQSWEKIQTPKKTKYANAQDFIFNPKFEFEQHVIDPSYPAVMLWGKFLITNDEYHVADISVQITVASDSAKMRYGIWRDLGGMTQTPNPCLLVACRGSPHHTCCRHPWAQEGVHNLPQQGIK